MLRGVGITKRFGGVTALRNVSFEVGAGELVGLIGPNGSGKSTLFSVISGFHPPDEGAIFFDGHDLPAPDRTLSPRWELRERFRSFAPSPV